ncbi:GntR family transcriptional regulator [Streptomyces sp. NPDC059835]|uniref:GntR family transcriptional regulator n=1 Tax=unclassified Streptomyces TaxID=2593676 RepID=UPI00365C0467
MHRLDDALLLGPSEQPWAVWLSGSGEVLERPSRDAALVTAATRNNAYARTQAGGPVAAAQYAVLLHHGREWREDETRVSARVSPDTRKVHIRLAELLREQIRAACLRPGQMLPTQRKLAADYTVGLRTVELAQAELIREGLIVKTGRGFVVSSLPPVEEQQLPGLGLPPNAAAAEPAAAARARSHAGTAAYRLLAQRLDELLDEGAYPPGARIPSARALAKQHGYTLASAQQAVRSLKDRGRLVEGPGGETVVPHTRATAGHADRSLEGDTTAVTSTPSSMKKTGSNP